MTLLVICRLQVNLKSLPVAPSAFGNEPIERFLTRKQTLHRSCLASRIEDNSGRQELSVV